MASTTRFGLPMDTPQPYDSYSELHNNNHLLAMLYTLATPGAQTPYQFDTVSKQICIDTGALACISTQRDSFIALRETPSMQINGIA
jgi:hypothetical protein